MEDDETERGARHRNQKENRRQQWVTRRKGLVFLNTDEAFNAAEGSHL
jgi:hypothetical protein